AVHRSVVVRDLCVVRVVNSGGVNVGHCNVIAVDISLPLATIEAFTWIAVSVINPAVEADLRSPIARIPPITAINPTPISRSPEQAWLRRQDPCARDPIIVGCIGVPRPVTRCPEVTFIRTNGLVVNWQRRWAHTNHNRDLSWRKRWRQQKKQGREKNPTKGLHCSHHRCASLCACCAGSGSAIACRCWVAALSGGLPSCHKP